VRHVFALVGGTRNFTSHSSPIKAVKTVAFNDSGGRVEAPEHVFEGRLDGCGAGSRRSGYGDYRVLL
jgi:hypothetical protein